MCICFRAYCFSRKHLLVDSCSHLVCWTVLKFSILSTSALMFTFRFECHEKGLRFPESIFFYYYFSLTRTSFIPDAPFISWPVIYRACRRKTASPKGWFFFFLLEKHEVTLLYTHCRRTLPWARGSPATAQVSRRLEADRSGLERREWLLAVTAAFLLQLGLFSLWAPCTF